MENIRGQWPELVEMIRSSDDRFRVANIAQQFLQNILTTFELGAIDSHEFSSEWIAIKHIIIRSTDRLMVSLFVGRFFLGIIKAIEQVNAEFENSSDSDSSDIDLSTSDSGLD